MFKEVVERVITCVHSLRERLNETLLAHRNEILALHSRIEGKGKGKGKGILQHHQIILEFEAILKENKKKLADGAFFGVLKQASQKAIVLPPWVALAVRPRPGPRLQINSEEKGTNADIEEGFDNNEDSDHDVEYFNDPDLDEVLGDIDDEGPEEVEDVHAPSFRNSSLGIGLRNDLGA
ncbi:hypothetical protein PVK06_029972 [Gossypium arboreum]|uniref:sucrose synthase n=1 Tax=Gossypium arboreum TaxID=29729 RepID=A0ABR0NM15_GOSAR|nr:hypothetical protein PVK06_029972 [Gossypium arboreum]